MIPFLNNEPKNWEINSTAYTDEEDVFHDTIKATNIKTFEIFEGLRSDFNTQLALTVIDESVEGQTVKGFFPGVPGVSQLLYAEAFSKPITFLAGLPLAVCKSLLSATAATDIDIKKNGTSIGTIHFAIGGTVATFVFAAKVSFAAGDIIKLVAPASADATLGDIVFNLTGY